MCSFAFCICLGFFFLQYVQSIGIGKELLWEKLFKFKSFHSSKRQSELPLHHKYNLDYFCLLWREHKQVAKYRVKGAFKKAQVEDVAEVVALAPSWHLYHDLLTVA